MQGYVYILKTKLGTNYIGSTTNLERRFAEHIGGRVFSTKNKLPVYLYAYRMFIDIKDASRWEKKYKRSHGQLERDVKKGILIITPDGKPESKHL